LKLAKQQIARQFSRAAGTYDRAAQLQNEMAKQLIVAIPAELNGAAVDLGCGTGWALEKIATLDRFELTAVDIAPGMIEVARDRVPSATFHCCDLEETPLPDHWADLVFTSSAIQWCDTATALQEIKRISKPGGCLLGSTFGPGTFAELKAAWEAAGDQQTRIHKFDSRETIESTLLQLGFLDICVESRNHWLEFTRHPGLLGTQRYREFRSVLKQRLAQDELGLTFESISISARIR